MIAKLPQTSCHANQTMLTALTQVKVWCARITKAITYQVHRLIKWIPWSILPRNLNTTQLINQTSVAQNISISNQQEYKTKWRFQAYFWKAVRAACSLSNKCNSIKAIMGVLDLNPWHQTFRSPQWVLMASNKTLCKLNRCTILSVDTFHRVEQSTWPHPIETNTFSKTISLTSLSHNLVWERHSSRWTSSNHLCSLKT